MTLPELIVNSPTPGSEVANTTLGAAVVTAPAALTVETWTFTPPAGLGIAGQYHFRVDSEICIDTTGAGGSSRTVVRGAEGTTPATHLNGAGVFVDLTAEALKNVIATVTVPLVNLVPNPSFEHDTLGSAPAWWTNYTMFALTAGATLTVVAGGLSSPQCCQVAAAATQQGMSCAIPGTLRMGVPHTLSFWAKGAVGGEVFDFWFGDTTGGPVADYGGYVYAPGNVLTASWQRFSITWTPSVGYDTPDAVTVNFRATYTAITFLVDDIAITETSGPVPYFDGDSPGYFWSGTPGDSTSKLGTVGATGASGPAGAAGPSGAAGARGSLWFNYTGTTTPAAGTFAGEADGDECIRQFDGEVFLRVTGAWVDQGYSLMGSNVRSAFQMRSTSAATLSTGVDAKIPLGTIGFDLAGWCATGRFTPQLAGYYQIDAGVSSNGVLADGTDVVLRIFKNGASLGGQLGIAEVIVSSGGSNWDALATSALVYMNGSTDYLELWGASSTSAGGAVAITFTGWMSGFMAQAPTAAPVTPNTAASMTRNAALTLAAATYTVMPFDTVNFDPGANCTTGAAAGYKVPKAGLYQVNARMFVNVPSAAYYELIVAVAKNGGRVSESAGPGIASGSSDDYTGQVSTIISCVAGDVIQVIYNSTIAATLVAGLNLLSELSVVLVDQPVSAGVPADGTVTTAKLSGALTTPSTLEVTGALTADAGIVVTAQSGNAIKTSQVAANIAFAQYLLTADANPAFTVKGDGTVSWGAGGSTAVDTTLSRASAGVLQTGALTLTAGLFKPFQHATSGEPAYVKGGMYFNTTLNKLRIGGATAWETVTSA